MDRTKFAGLTENGVVMMEPSGDRRHIKVKGDIKKALKELEHILLLGHNEVIMYGTDYDGPAFDLFGHSGAEPYVAAALRLNLENERFKPFEFPEIGMEDVNEIHLRRAPNSNWLYGWSGEKTCCITVVNLKTGKHVELDVPWVQSHLVDLHHQGDKLRVVGATEYPESTDYDLILAQYDASQWPPERLSSSTLQLPDYREFIEVRFSADGKRVAWSTRENLGSSRGRSRLGLVDVENAQSIFTFQQSKAGSYYGVEPLSWRDAV
ncbi:MAG: hypothetical protein ABEJ65_04675, partial [bacterium]